MANNPESVTSAAPSAPVEIELKLATDADGLAALSDAPELDGQSSVRRLDSTYFDTRDRRLTARGITLRVRKIGRRYVQTIKTAGKGSAGGLSTRSEWEWPVDGPKPDLSVIDDHNVIGLIGLVRPQELQAVFGTRVRRTIRTLEFGGAQIEVALDDGEVVAGRRRQPLHEVELELLAGDVDPLYELALALNRRHTLSIDPRSKAARGEALANGSAPQPKFQSSIDLPGDVTVDDGLALILGNCLTHWTENLPAVREGDDPEGIHQARVALRRLRSALQLFRPVIGAAEIEPLKHRLRALGNAMGPARDADVFIDEMLGPVATAMPQETSLAVLKQAAEAWRREGYAEARMTLDGPEATEMALSMGHWIALRGWRQQPYSPTVEWLDRPMVDLADQLLQRRLRAVLKRGRGFANLPADARHEVRIAMKKLRYAVDFCAPLYPSPATKLFFKHLKRLQSLLGHLQDQAMTEAALSHLGGDGADAKLQRAVGLIAGWHAHAMVDLSTRTNAEWTAFKSAKPFWHV